MRATYATGVSWRDLGDDPKVQELFAETTLGQVESHVAAAIDQYRRMSEFLRLEQIEANGNWKNIELQDTRWALNLSFWVGGEVGQRIGREAGKRMISEAHQFASNYTGTIAPFLAEVNHDDDD